MWSFEIFAHRGTEARFVVDSAEIFIDPGKQFRYNNQNSNFRSQTVPLCLCVKKIISSASPTIKTP
jgi:hypothetical protein